MAARLQALNRHAEAVASFDKALAIDKAYADAHSNRALSLLTLGELARGFAEYEWRWKRAGMTDLRRNYRGALWLGEYPLARKRILLHAEQGLGDTIQFARYVPLVARMGATVVLEVQPELKPLFEGMAGAAFVHARGEPLPAYDLHCPLGSLPLALKTAPATIPADYALFARRCGAHRRHGGRASKPCPANASRSPGPAMPATSMTATARSRCRYWSRCSRSPACRS